MIRRYGLEFFAGQGAGLTSTQRKVLAALAGCRTAAMGAHVQRCEHCGGEVILYNSCGDRHCPKCQGGKRAQWFDKRRQDLLPVEYFHVVFTVPELLNLLARAHPEVFYNLLFRAARETLLEVAATPRHLGGQIGGLMVLHTWGQNLWLHRLSLAVIQLADRSDGTTQRDIRWSAAGLRTGRRRRRLPADGDFPADGSRAG